MDKEFLFQERVREILRPLALDQEVPIRITNAYTERWRTYHNYLHILQMLRLAETFGLSSKILQNLNLLIVYHDIQYKVLRASGYNELSSFKWAKADIETSQILDPISLKRTCRMLKQGIMATVDHSLNKVNAAYVMEVSLLLDLDLWILAQDFFVFNQYNENIWGEYQPILTREEFLTGRADWAQSFLKRPRIYLTEHFQHLEDRARHNLSGLIGQASHLRSTNA